jgi:hypothetical protein
MKEVEMCGSCSTLGRDERCIQNLKGRDHSEDVGVYEKIILEWILGKWDGKVWTGFI